MKYIIIAGALILIAFLAVLYFIPLGIEPLTEVYIENHEQLPKNVYLNKTYNFSFTTHNLEYQDVKYDYTVKAFDANGTLLYEIESGSFLLANNESETAYVGYKFDEEFKRARIQIIVEKSLIGEPEF